MRKLVSTLVVALVLVGASGAEAQEARAIARDVVNKWQEAIVTVRVVLKTRMSVQGREVQSTDDSVDAVGTVIDPSGLTVMSLGSLNPGAMMTRLMASSGSGENRVDMSTEPSDLKIRLADGRELPARIVLRDEDLDLAFIRPTTKPATGMVAVKLADSAKPELLEQVLILSRLGRVGGWGAAAAFADVGAVITRPRTFYVLAGAPSSMGTPAFTTSGKLVGLLTIRQVDAGRSSMMSMMGGAEAMGMLPVILPAADVLEISLQAEER